MTEAEDRLRRLLDVGKTLAAELDTEELLERVLELARSLTGARYAALGVLDESRHGLGRFLTAGVDRATQRSIGQLPRGRGVLGVLIEDPTPVRIPDVDAHPDSYGFPPGHPEMHSFLGVPIVIRGEAWGNLYLTEKQGGEPFSEGDEEAAIALAQWAAIAIENARAHELSERRRVQLEVAVQWLEASRDISAAIGGVGDLDRVLELIVKRGRALVSAQSLLVMMREGDDLVVTACAGRTTYARGRRVTIAGSTSGEVLERGRPQRVNDVTRELLVDPSALGVSGAHTALLVPMLHRGVAIGILAAFDHGEDGQAFSAGDEGLLQGFAQAAANAVAIKRSVEADRLRTTMAAADAERGRWARELHDETLQALGGLRVQLAASVGRGDVTTRDHAMRQAIEDIELGIANLREMISDLRPSLLDDLGLGPAIEALLERRRGDGLRIEAELGVPAADGQARTLAPELETTVFRLVQEALTNVIKHAQASRVTVSVRAEAACLLVEIRDDGRGFDPSAGCDGFGLAGMRERVGLADGTLEIDSDGRGTSVRARLPHRLPDATVVALRGQLAS